MKTASPLRYPGGKSAMSNLLAGIRRANGLGDRAIAEPFAGGAGASLGLLYLEETHRVLINDADRAIFDFWWTLKNRPEPFLKKLDETAVTIDEWKRQRDLYRKRGRISRLSRGFAAFYLNRCNRSGIIGDGGPIGGIEQSGEWKIDARFNKKNLMCRCKKVAEYSERIQVTGNDGIAFLSKLNLQEVFCFIDPPYFEKGKTLYMNHLDEAYHKKLADRLQQLDSGSWVLTYDDCPEIRRLYEGWANVRPFSLRYTASRRTKGRELLITPQWMRLPKSQCSASIYW